MALECTQPPGDLAPGLVGARGHVAQPVGLRVEPRRLLEHAGGLQPPLGRVAHERLERAQVARPRRRERRRHLPLPARAQGVGELTVLGAAAPDHELGHVADHEAQLLARDALELVARVGGRALRSAAVDRLHQVEGPLRRDLDRHADVEPRLREAQLALEGAEGQERAWIRKRPRRELGLDRLRARAERGRLPAQLVVRRRRTLRLVEARRGRPPLEEGADPPQALELALGGRERRLGARDGVGRPALGGAQDLERARALVGALARRERLARAPSLRERLLALRLRLEPTPGERLLLQGSPLRACVALRAHEALARLGHRGLGLRERRVGRREPGRRGIELGAASGEQPLGLLRRSHGAPPREQVAARDLAPERRVGQRRRGLEARALGPGGLDLALARLGVAGERAHLARGLDAPGRLGALRLELGAPGLERPAAELEGPFALGAGRLEARLGRARLLVRPGHGLARPRVLVVGRLQRGAQDLHLGRLARGGLLVRPHGVERAARLGEARRRGPPRLRAPVRLAHALEARLRLAEPPGQERAPAEELLELGLEPCPARGLLAQVDQPLLGRLRRLSRAHQRGVLGAPEAPRGRERLVHARLRALEHPREERVLRHGVQGGGQAPLARVVGVVGEALREDRLGLRLAADQEPGQVGVGQAALPPLAPRPRRLHAPAQERPEPAFDLAPLALGAEGAVARGALEQGRAPDARAERLVHAPALRLPALAGRLEHQRDLGGAVGVPGHVGFARLRGGDEEQRGAQRLRQVRLAEVVRTVEHVEARAELEARRDDRAEVLHLERQEAHVRRAP